MIARKAALRRANPRGRRMGITLGSIWTAAVTPRTHAETLPWQQWH